MQVTVEEISPVEKKIAVQIDWPLVAAKLDEAYRELGRGVALKGFRKGKVPRPMLEKMYARQVESEVKQRLIQESILKVAQQHEINPVVEPVVDDMKLEKGQGFAYSARFEVRPEFEVKDYEGVALEREKPVVTDEEVEQALANKQREVTEFKKIDGRTELRAGDVAFVDLEGKLGEHPINRNGAMVDVGPGENVEAVPGLNEALVGVALNAEKLPVTFTVKAPQKGEPPAEIKDLIGTEVTITVTVREAREKSVPPLDDDFAKDTGEADTLAELKDKLRGRVAEQKDKAQEHELRAQALKKVLEKNPFQVPPALVERQIDQLIRRARVQLAMRGVDYRTVNLDENRMRADLRDGAVEDVRGWFVLDAVATKEKIEVTDADLEKRIAELARDRGKPVPKLKAELQKEGQIEQLKWQLREEKTLDLLLSRANINVKAQ